MVNLGVKGYTVFVNGGYISPTAGSMRQIVSVLFPEAYPSEVTMLWADAASCYKLLPRKTMQFPGRNILSSAELDWFVVEFWDGCNISNADAVLSIGVYAASYWDAKYFLKVMEEDARKHGAITISKS